ncbi:MAG: type I methionyl aminopeptidase [Actinomycetota bacterium]|nr:type I methionyl aminopeptidase [Actinomycetota bacterium]
MIVCRSNSEIERIREAGRIVAQALLLAGKVIEPGISTLEIDAYVEARIKKQKGRPAFKGYRGFPAATCISIDEVVVHGIPGTRRLRAGQIVGVDIGVELNGYFADAAATFAVAEVAGDVKKLMETGQAALAAGINMAVGGNHLYDISAEVQRVAEGAGYSVVRDFVGHGIGRDLHEEPQIPNYAQTGRGPKLNPGMVLALEPMVNMGGYEVEVMKDQWTVVTLDRRESVHYEHTIVITEGEPEILTVL